MFGVGIYSVLLDVKGGYLRNFIDFFPYYESSSQMRGAADWLIRIVVFCIGLIAFRGNPRVARNHATGPAASLYPGLSGRKDSVCIEMWTGAAQLDERYLVSNLQYMRASAQVVIKWWG